MPDTESKRARIVWRETPAQDMGKPETVREIVTGKTFDEIRENFWKQPAFAPSKMRKVEILTIEWIS